MMIGNSDHGTGSKAGFATRAIHYGYDPLANQGALTPPIHVTSTFVFETARQGAEMFTGEREGYIYTRLGNPTQALLESRLASLENGEAALATASGMGAITATFWTLMAPGDEIIIDKTLYGCTFTYFTHILHKFGVTISHVDLTTPENLIAALTPRTRAVYFESPANPNMRVIDIAAVARIAHGQGVPVIVDNTYCTPYLQRPLELGADLVVHSATKYLGGHGDLMAGAVVGRRETIDAIRMIGLKDATGAVISPMDAFLVLRGMKTLELRMDRHCANAQAVAELLENHPTVSTVYYPGLPSFPWYELAQRQMARPGGMITFELMGGMPAGIAFMDAVKVVTRAVSLGDAESLVQHPASMTHSTYTPEERAVHGITDGMVRLSIGLESLPDLLGDIGRALDIAESVTAGRTVLAA